MFPQMSSSKISFTVPQNPVATEMPFPLGTRRSQVLELASATGIPIKILGLDLPIALDAQSIVGPRSLWTQWSICCGFRGTRALDFPPIETPSRSRAFHRPTSTPHASWSRRVLPYDPEKPAVGCSNLAVVELRSKTTARGPPPSWLLWSRSSPLPQPPSLVLGEGSLFSCIATHVWARGAFTLWGRHC